MSHVMSPDRGTPAVRSLVSAFSIEATVGQLRRGAGALDRMPRGTSIYIPALPNQNVLDAVGPCRELTAQGLRPVPHIAARAIASRQMLHTALMRFADAGVEDVMLIAGDVAEPAGPFDNTLDILDTGLLEACGMRRIGIAGHPDGHPFVDADELDRALALKWAYARDTGTLMWIVTQFTFAASGLVALDRGLRSAGLGFPIRAGVPGPTPLRKLAAYAIRCGVGSSLRVLARRRDAVNMLRRWTPDELVRKLGEHLAAEPDSLIRDIHIYPFGGVREAMDWLDHVAGDAQVPQDATPSSEAEATS